MADAARSVVDELRQRMHEIEAKPAGGLLGEQVVGEIRRKPRDTQSDDDDEQRAFKKIVALVNASDKSEKTVRERLRRLEFDEASIERAVERARAYRIIDDERFADVLIRSRISQGRGAAGIERELVENDIDPSTVPGWPHDYVSDEQTEFDRALQVLERNPPRSKNKRDGAYRKLVQKGFSSSVAASAARSWSEAQAS